MLALLPLRKLDIASAVTVAAARAEEKNPPSPWKGAMGVHSNITPDNYAPCGCAARFAAVRPHNWRYVQVPACQGALSRTL
jgi:hypothetical protein